jgi:hypothetical protein
MDVPSPPQLIELKCRNCGAPLTEDCISKELSAVRCPHCQALYALPPAGLERKSYARPPVELPKSFQMESVGGVLELTRRWREPVAYFLLFFAIFWNGFMLNWNRIAFTSGSSSMALFGVLHTGIGLFLIYVVTALFVNRTVIRASREKIEVKIGPLPWRGNKEMSESEVEQFFCKEKISKGKNGPTYSYEVQMVLKGNRRETLVSGMSDADHALFIEQQLERYLGIQDVPVEGEYGR